MLLEISSRKYNFYRLYIDWLNVSIKKKSLEFWQQLDSLLLYICFQKHERQAQQHFQEQQRRKREEEERQRQAEYQARRDRDDGRSDSSCGDHHHDKSHSGKSRPGVGEALLGGRNPNVPARFWETTMSWNWSRSSLYRTSFLPARPVPRSHPRVANPSYRVSLVLSF